MQVFYIHEVIKIVIICKNKNLISISSYIIQTRFKKLNNSQKFINTYFISYFSQNHLF